MVFQHQQGFWSGVDADRYWWMMGWWLVWGRSQFSGESCPSFREKDLRSERRKVDEHHDFQKQSKHHSNGWEGFWNRKGKSWEILQNQSFYSEDTVEHHLEIMDIPALATSNSPGNDIQLAILLSIDVFKLSIHFCDYPNGGFLK